MNGAVRRPIFRTYRHGDFDAAALADDKARHGHVVSVCLPARDEAATVGPIVEQIRTVLVDGCGLVDEILVMDDHSTDDTARIAAEAGARVVAVDDVLPELGPGEGKGEALYKSVAAAAGDLIAWCDADIREFAAHFVVGLVGPLLTRSDISFVKGFYDRPSDGSPHGGGRVTELMARPVIARAVPPPGLDRAAPRRASTPAGGRCSSGCRSCRATASTSGCSSTSPRWRAPRPSPRSTSGSVATATGRSTSWARRRWRCSRPPSGAPADRPERDRPRSSGPTWSPWRCAPTNGPPSSTSPATAVAPRRPSGSGGLRVGRSA